MISCFNINDRCLLFFLLLSLSFCMHSCDESIQVPAEIVDFYATHCNPDYPKKFVETACLKVVRDHKKNGMDYLKQQYHVDRSAKNLSKSNIFKQMSGFCQTLANIYIHNKYFIERYDVKKYQQAFKSWFDRGAITANRLLSVYDSDRVHLTSDYATKSMQIVSCVNDNSSVVCDVYMWYEAQRLDALAQKALPVVSTINRSIFNHHLQDQHLSDFLEYMRENTKDSFNKTLYCMGIEVVKHQSSLSTSEWTSREYDKVCDFYNSIDGILTAFICADAGYRNFAESCLISLVSKNFFQKSLFGKESVGGCVTRHLCSYLLSDLYVNSMKKPFEDLGVSMQREYVNKAQELFYCYSQDARATLLLKQYDRDMVQLFAQKSKAAVALTCKFMLDQAQRVKGQILTGDEQRMVEQQQKLQVDAQAWIDGVQQLEKQHDGFEQTVQTSFDMMQLEKQHVNDIHSVGVDYLEQKNNRALQKPTMQRWINFVGLQKVARAQRYVQADTLQNQNDVRLLRPYFDRWGRVKVDRKMQLQNFQTKAAEWEESQSKLEDERKRIEQNMSVDQLALRNQIKQREQERSWLKFCVVGWMQVMRDNKKIRNDVDDAVSNASTEPSAVAGEQLGLSLIAPVVSSAAGLSTRSNNPYKARVMGVDQSRQKVGRFVAEDGTHWYALLHNLAE